MISEVDTNGEGKLSEFLSKVDANGYVTMTLTPTDPKCIFPHFYADFYEEEEKE